MTAKTGRQGQQVVLAYRRARYVDILCGAETYGCEVVTFTADLAPGRERERRAASRDAGFKPEKTSYRGPAGRFVRDYVFRSSVPMRSMRRSNLLGTLHRTALIGRRIEIARQTGRMPFAMRPARARPSSVELDITISSQHPIVAPWREWAIEGPRGALEFPASTKSARQGQEGEAPSRRRQSAALSYEGKVLEDPASNRRLSYRSHQPGGRAGQGEIGRSVSSAGCGQHRGGSYRRQPPCPPQRPRP